VGGLYLEIGPRIEFYNFNPNTHFTMAVKVAFKLNNPNRNWLDVFNV
jgi:hypothetical protein